MFIEGHRNYLENIKMTLETKNQFNAESAPVTGTWPVETYQAFAKWWADQLPGAALFSSQEFENCKGKVEEALAIKVVVRGQKSVSADQYRIFLETLVEKLKECQPRRLYEPEDDESLSILLQTDYLAYGPLAETLEKAGLNDMTSLPWHTSAYLKEDGLIFVYRKQGPVLVVKPSCGP
jgi:hypothetical protein